MNKKDKEDFKNAKKCYACDKKFETTDEEFEKMDALFMEDKISAEEFKNYMENIEKEKKQDKVKDHCHFTGKYRGAACQSCNSKMKFPKFIPVILHNLQNYDSHLFIKSLGVSEGEINCIHKTEEKYISFSKDVIVDSFFDKKTNKKILVKRQLRFIDSFKFMSSSLENLVKNLNPDNMHILKEFFPDEEESKLLKRKGVFPYDWFLSLDKLEKEKLPKMDKFYSKLNDKNISEEDYEHANKVWKKFNIKNMRDYHDLYLKTDVILLADVFENFRKVCKNIYNLDPGWYFTSPGLAWDPMLKFTKVELELLSDSEMYLMIEKGIRGGISSSMKRYAKSNNEYMGEKYDPKQENSYIIYLDANNLYGWAMCKKSPVRNFKWMDEDELENWRKIPCILEVDFEYPEELHDFHNEYPLVCEKIKIGTVEKLVPTLRDKYNYVIHYENLKLYEKLGLKITKIHRGVKFYEENFMEKYINLNTKLRMQAKNDFEKDFFKLMNNSVFGKTMENLRNRVDIQLCSQWWKAKKLFSKTNYDKRTIFSDHLIAVHMHKTRLKLDKPIYLGMSILDLSKTLMYEFHYNYIKKKFGKNAELLYTDTDSLKYLIKTKDFYKDISDDIVEWFDTSNYPKEHPIFYAKNKKVIGKMKDEHGGKNMC